MKKLSIIVAVALLLVLAGALPVAAEAPVVLGADVATAANAAGSSDDGSIGAGSWAAVQTGKMELYIDPTVAPFDGLGTFTVDDIASISYQTKKPGAEGDVDFYIVIYTAVDGNDDTSNWFGYRLNAEPYFSQDLNALANQWNTWTTDDAVNQLTFFDTAKTAGGFGFYNQPTLQDLQAGVINWHDYNNTYADQAIDYGAEIVKYITFQTGSDWDDTFYGNIDAISINLTGGRSLTVDLEEFYPEVWVDDDAEASWYAIPGHFATFQEAIDAVLEGGTVHVADGTYSENPTMGKSLSLVGPADGSSATIEGTLTLASTAGGALIDRINFLAVDSADNIVLQGVNGVTIVNCSFDGAGGFMSGGRAVQMSPKCSNVTIDNCTFQNGYYVTIQGNVDDLTVRNSTITSVKSGINLQAGNNLVVENTDVSVVAQGETNDTYCVRFSSNLPSVSTNMSIAGGTFSVNKNNIDAALGTYHSAIIVRSGAGGQLKANWLSIDGEVVNLSTTQLDATSNYWGPEGPDEPEGRVSGEVDTSNWLSPERVLTEYPEIDLPTLSLQAPVATGKTGLADVQVMLDPGDFEVFGFEFIVRYDADVLSAEPDDVQPGEVLKDMDQLDLESMSGEGGYTWIVQQPEAGKLYVRVTLLDDENDSIAGIMGTEAELAKVSFTAAATGDCADPSDVWLSDEILTQKQDGARIHPVTVGEPVTITAYKLVPVSGAVELQGRNVGKWGGAKVTLTGTDNMELSYDMTTSSSGAWSETVACGTYDVNVVMGGYLRTWKNSLSAPFAANAGKLLGGNADMTEGSYDIIFLHDVVAIANVIGDEAEDMSDENLYPDINGDSTINILDLVLAGINYTEEAQSF